MTSISREWLNDLQQGGYQIKIFIYWYFGKFKKTGPVSALLGPHQHALDRMYIHNGHTVKTNVWTIRMSQIHAHKIANSDTYIEWK